MPVALDLIHQTSTDTGTSDFTLTSVDGKRDFSEFSGSFDYFISNRSAAEWEIGTTSLVSGLLDRANAVIINSSNVVSGVAELVNFSAGTKDITNDVPAQYQGNRLLAIRSYTSGTTWNKPSNLSYVVVKLIGGGGGGSTTINHYGGSGGGYSEKVIQAAALGSSETVTVAAAQTTASTGGNTSSFGSHLSATGGGAGGASSGTPGVGSGGDINLSGGRGSLGITGVTLGTGGGAPIIGVYTGQAGNAGSQPSFGQGGATGSTYYNGGPGLVLVYEYGY